MKFHSTASHLLARVATAHKNYLERSLTNVGLHSGQVFILIELWKRDGRRQVDLASALNVSPPTINKTLSGLIDSGLVSCSRLEDDSRSMRVFLTDAGREIRSAVETEWHEIEEQLLSELTDAERMILTELLVKLKAFYFGTNDE